MNFAVDILHPAHVHVFRPFIQAMKERGHKFLVTAREKDCAVDLLNAYKIEHVVLSRLRPGGLNLAWELMTRTWRFWRLAKPFGPDYLIGIMGPTIALAGKCLSARTVIFYDTEMAKITNRFAYPLADRVCTPDCYQGSAGRHHVRYPGYHELAYLHPARFAPDPSILERHGIRLDAPLFFVRFVSWEASHDSGEKGFSLEGKRRLVRRLAERGRVLISSESPLPEEFEPYRFDAPVELVHHVLAYVHLLVGESATMASEAAVLGTHALFISKTGRGYTDEQEARYGLVHHYTHTQDREAMDKIEELLAHPDLKADAAERRERLLSEKTDVTAWMIDYFERGAPLE